MTKKWNLAAIFENDVLRVFEFVKDAAAGGGGGSSGGGGGGGSFQGEDRIISSSFSLFFTHTFTVSIDRMKLLPGVGLLVTSPKGYFYIFSDHLTSSNSSEDVKTIPQYYID